MDVDEARARMQEIQRIMERATLFTLLPGTPAVIGGLLVLAGLRDQLRHVPLPGLRRYSPPIVP